MIEYIHLSARQGQPMVGVTSVEVIAGTGLAGDRYSVGSGFWKDNRVSRAITLVESESIDRLGTELGVDIQPGELRRNITTRGIALNDLVDRWFWIGEVLARGTSLCEPCSHLAELTGKAVLKPMVHRGGLRADVYSSGRVNVGDSLVAAQEAPGVGVMVFSGEKLLLGRRLSNHGFGTWATPGGKPERGESFESCALRELQEETGMIGSAPTFVGETLNGFPESRQIFRTRFYRVQTAGSPEPKEPDKVASWRWFARGELPQPLFRPVATALERLATGAVWPS